MPAVDLTALNNRIQSMSLYRNNPETYIDKLEDLFGMYSSKEIQLGENIPIQTLLPRLNVPNLVIEKVIETFPALASELPENALTILDALWDKEELEFKILAINLLLNLPSEMTDAINQRLPQWITSTDEELLHTVILTQFPFSHPATAKNLRLFIDNLFHSEATDLRGLAFRILAKVIEQNYFSDLPWVFNLITPFLEKASINTYRELNTVMNTLIKKSEIETTSFLCDLYTQSASPKARKYIRKIIPLFSVENQTYLLQVLQKN